MNAHIVAGELTKARAYLTETDATHKRAKLLFFEGQWELAGKGLSADSERWRSTGNRQGEMDVALDLARLHNFTGGARTGHAISAAGA
jgi:hypothetical protein